MSTTQLKTSPDDLIKLARELYRQWRLNEAQSTLETLLEAPGKHEVAALNLYSDVMWSLGDKDAALKATSLLLDLAPLDPVATRRAQWLGLELDPNRYSENWVYGIINDSKKASTYAMMARLLNETGHHERALTVARKGTRFVNRLVPVDQRTKAKLLVETAMSLEQLGKESEAIAVLDNVNPELPVKKTAALHKARLLHAAGNFEGALKALSPYYDDDEIAFNTARYQTLLSIGDLPGAFGLYKSRKETRVFEKLISNYSSRALADIPSGRGSLLVLAEGGPGDELRMSSLYGELLEYADAPYISCDPRLETLFARSYPHAKFLPSPRFRDELRKGDYASRSEVRDSLGAKLLTNQLLRHCANVNSVSSIFEFLAELRRTRSDFAKGSKLVADPAIAATFAAKIDPQRTNIGIAWRSLIGNSTRDKHYLSVDHLEALKQIPNAEFWLLQPGATTDEIFILRKHFILKVPEIDLIDDFEAQAGLIANLDAVIAPCTTTAELSGALGVQTFILANTQTTAWRKNADGSDVWHKTARLILSDPLGEKNSLIPQVVREFRAITTTHSTTEIHPPKAALGLKTRMFQTVARIPGARRVWRFFQKIVVAAYPTREANRTEDATIKRLLRQKDITDAHITDAARAVKARPSATLIAVKAALQFRAGNFSAALKTIATLPKHAFIKPDVLIATRTELADLGRHDLAKKGLQLLVKSAPRDKFEDATRVGNSEFEHQAWNYLSSIVQPTEPLGYLLAFPLNNRVTTGLFTPIAIELARQGFAVASVFAATMPRSHFRELAKISAAVRQSGMSLTNEPYRHRSLHNRWEIDLANRSVSCEGINYFTFFADRLGKLSNSYDLNLADPNLYSAFEALLQRSDVALTVCKRILKLARLGKPIRLVAMDTHFAPAGIVRKWCEEIGTKHGIELVALSISYENYYSNLTTLEAKTISVENLTARPDLRHPLFGGRKRFDDYIARHPDACVAKEEALSYIKVNRSRTEEADPVLRSDVIAKIEDVRRSGGKVFAALGKVLIDFAAPYDHGRVFSEFADWIRFLANEVASTDNLLIIKPHPHEKRSEIAVPGVQTLRDLLSKQLPDNVVFLDHAAFNSYELADLVDLTFVWNGTAYTEFPVLGKPIIAESIWAERDYPLNGRTLVSRAEYSSIIRGELDISISDDTVRRATAFIQFMKCSEVAIPFGYVRRAGTNQSIGSISFIESDMKALRKRSNSNLQLAASRFFERSAK